MHGMCSHCRVESGKVRTELSKLFDKPRTTISSEPLSYIKKSVLYLQLPSLLLNCYLIFWIWQVLTRNNDMKIFTKQFNTHNTQV